MRSCLNFCDEKIYLSWPGANGAEVGEMGHPAQGRGICVDNAQGFKSFEKLQNGGVLSNLVCFVSECEIEQINIGSDIVKRISMLGKSRSWWVRGWSILFTCGWGWYVVEMCLWPILGVEMRRCVNFCDEKMYSSWPGANRAEVGEMGHPAQGRGICVDNARGFKIFEKLQNGGVLSN